VAWWLVLADDRTLAVVGAVVGVLAPGVAVVAWLWRSPRSRRTETATLMAVADALAVAVSAQREAAAVERRLRHPAPVLV
jgi:hypothetical protein